MNNFFLNIWEYVMELFSSPTDFDSASKSILKAAGRGGGFAPLYTDSGVVVSAHALVFQRHINSLVANGQPIVFENCVISDVEITNLPKGTVFINCEISTTSIIIENIKFERVKFSKGTTFAGTNCLLIGCAFQKDSYYDSLNSVKCIHKGTTFADMIM